MGIPGGGVHSFLGHLFNAHPHATDNAAFFILKRKSAFLGLRLYIRFRRRILRLPILLMGFVIVCALLGGAVMPGCILFPVLGIHTDFFFHDRCFVCFFFRSFFCRIFLLRLFFCGCGLLFPGAEVFIHQTILGHFLDDFISAPKLFVCYGNHLLPAGAVTRAGLRGFPTCQAPVPASGQRRSDGHSLPHGQDNRGLPCESR